MIRHYNIPVFISHFGCPNLCVFCNQKKINGVETDITTNDLINIIEEHLKTIPKDAKKEIAFFGGTFTGISQEIQNAYLSIAKKYIDLKLVDGIRISTRPDYINEEILENLKKYGVKTIELGVQSLDDKVLRLSARDYTFDTVKKAAELIKKFGFELGIQLMIGLPASNLEIDIQSAIKTVSLKPQISRIYPTIVLKETELANIFYKGEYNSISLDEAIVRSKIIYSLLEFNNINVIRVGLQPSDSLFEDNSIIAGPFHPSFGELVEQAIYFDFLKKIYEKDKFLKIISNEKNISKIVGQKAKSKKYFSPNFSVKIDNNLDIKSIIVNEKKYNRNDLLKGVLDEYCHYF